MNKISIFGVILGILLFPSPSLASKITPENVLRLVNEERVFVGAGVIEREASLDEAANARLQDMKKYSYFGHTNLITHTSYSGFLPKSFDERYKGEVLGRWYNTSEGLVAGWMKSPTHQHAILNPIYTKTGIAISDGIVVQLFSN